MKILVYGTGVTASFLTHTLLKAGHEVHLIALGEWKENLRKNGLVIVHRLQRKETVDHPVVLETAENTHYDIVFCAVQGQKQKEMVPVLAGIDTDLVVMVGNNLQAETRYEEFRKLAEDTPLLFGFQYSAGLYEDGKMIAVYQKNGSMTIGGLHAEASVREKKLLDAAFFHTGYELEYMDHMDGWLLCHAAVVLPIYYVSYANDCNLRRVEGKTLDEMILAIRQGYALLRHCGVQIRLKRDVEFLRSGLGTSLIKLVFVIMAKTMLGELTASDQCRIAVSEKEWMDRIFEDMKEACPDVPMPDWERLRERMPDWNTIHAAYDT